MRNSHSCDSSGGIALPTFVSPTLSKMLVIRSIHVAYLITFITAQDLNWVAEYLIKVPPIVRNYEGEYLAVSKGLPNAVEVVEGTALAPQAIAILTFPSMDAVKRFLKAPEYTPFRKARVAATESSFYAFENDDHTPQFQNPIV